VAQSEPQSTLAEALRAIDQQLAEMGALCQQQLADAIGAFSRNDPALASRVMRRDGSIDQLELDVDHRAQRALVAHRPTGADLRFLTGAFKYVTDLERIGDLCSEIARMVVEVGHAPPESIRADLAQIAGLIDKNLRAVIEAFRGRDRSIALGVLAETVEIDRLNARLFIDLVARAVASQFSVLELLPVATLSRFLDRIADHVRSLAHEVDHMVKMGDADGSTPRGA
jgi:phosphate transport system protein